MDLWRTGRSVATSTRRRKHLPSVLERTSTRRTLNQRAALTRSAGPILWSTYPSVLHPGPSFRTKTRDSLALVDGKHSCCHHRRFMNILRVVIASQLASVPSRTSLRPCGTSSIELRRQWERRTRKSRSKGRASKKYLQALYQTSLAIRPYSSKRGSFDTTESRTKKLQENPRG